MTLARFPDQISRIQVIAQSIRDLRADQKQEWIASLVGCSRRQWIRWERGEAIPSYRAILRIQKVYPAFHVTL